MLGEQYNPNYPTFTQRDFDKLCFDIEQTRFRLDRTISYPNQVECFILMSTRFRHFFFYHLGRRQGSYCLNEIAVENDEFLGLKIITCVKLKSDYEIVCKL